MYTTGEGGYVNVKHKKHLERETEEEVNDLLKKAFKLNQFLVVVAGFEILFVLFQRV